MFQIINSFTEGEITDEQCKHCLAATHLGAQYVFISDEAIKQVKLIERCYLADNEKEYYQNIRTEDAKLGDNKVKLARIQYRGKGKYIDEILVQYYARVKGEMDKRSQSMKTIRTRHWKKFEDLVLARQ